MFEIYRLKIGKNRGLRRNLSALRRNLSALRRNLSALRRSLSALRRSLSAIDVKLLKTNYVDFVENLCIPL